MMITVDGLGVCDDCAMVIANADWTGVGYGLTAEETEERETAIRDGLNARPGHWVLTCHGEDGDPDYEFSRWPCDCCRTKLAGLRHPAAILH